MRTMFNGSAMRLGVFIDALQVIVPPPFCSPATQQTASPTPSSFPSPTLSQSQCFASPIHEAAAASRFCPSRSDFLPRPKEFRRESWLRADKTQQGRHHIFSALRSVHLAHSDSGRG